MRYDDRLDTIMRQPVAEPRARVAIWRQMVDLVAQGDGRLDPDLHKALLERINSWNGSIPPDQRRRAAESLKGRCHSALLVAHFGADEPVVAAPVLLSARLLPEEWEALIPGFPPASRALLRERRDLPETAQRLLNAYQSGDFALPRPAENVVRADLPAREHDQIEIDLGQRNTSLGGIQISELVARIEAYRQAKVPAPSSDSELPIPGNAGQFRFGAGADGIISWMDGAPRGPVIGLSLAEMADARSAGVDGHAAGAFRQRNRFRDARLLVAGEGPSGGQWLISGDPQFEQETGRFKGYIGVARRPAPDELAGGKSFSVFGGHLQPDSIRQLIHELRTPLNAIRGFAEMIEGQFLGPVAQPYQDRAKAIISEANSLLATFEDLDGAAKLESGTFQTPSAIAEADCSAALHAVLAALLPLSERTAARFLVEKDAAGLWAACSPVSVERIFSRSLAAMLGLAEKGEVLPLSLRRHHDSIALTIGLPARLARNSAQDLLDPNFLPAGDWPDAPALGLGFSLRLVANIVQAEGGSVDIQDGRLALNMPAARDSADGQQGRI